MSARGNLAVLLGFFVGLLVTAALVFYAGAASAQSASPTPSNNDPVAGDDDYKVKEDKKLQVDAPGVLTYDYDPDKDPLTASLVSGPKKAKQFTLNPDGSFTYKPKKDFHGKDSFTYRVSDGKGGTDTGTVEIKVKGTKD